MTKSEAQRLIDAAVEKAMGGVQKDWITINGTHVEVDGDGNIITGPSNLKSGNSGSKGGSGSKNSGSKSSTSSQKREKSETDYRYLEQNTKIAQGIKQQMERTGQKSRTIQFEEMSGGIKDMSEACRAAGLKVDEERAFNITVKLK